MPRSRDFACPPCFGASVSTVLRRAPEQRLLRLVLARIGAEEPAKPDIADHFERRDEDVEQFGHRFLVGAVERIVGARSRPDRGKPSGRPGSRQARRRCRRDWPRSPSHRRSDRGRRRRTAPRRRCRTARIPARRAPAWPRSCPASVRGIGGASGPLRQALPEPASGRALAVRPEQDALKPVLLRYGPKRMISTVDQASTVVPKLFRAASSALATERRRALASLPSARWWRGENPGRPGRMKPSIAWR